MASKTGESMGLSTYAVYVEGAAKGFLNNVTGEYVCADCREHYWNAGGGVWIWCDPERFERAKRLLYRLESSTELHVLSERFRIFSPPPSKRYQSRIEQAKRDAYREFTTVERWDIRFPMVDNLGYPPTGHLLLDHWEQERLFSVRRHILRDFLEV